VVPVHAIARQRINYKALHRNKDYKATVRELKTSKDVE